MQNSYCSYLLSSIPITHFIAIASTFLDFSQVRFNLQGKRELREIRRVFCGPIMLDARELFFSGSSAEATGIIVFYGKRVPPSRIATIAAWRFVLPRCILVLGPTNVPDLMNPKGVWNGDRRRITPRIQAS
jgi:hypothetical protein